MANFNLNELTLDTIGQWPKPIKLGMVIAVLLLLIGMGYWLIIKGSLEQYDSLKQQEVTIKSEFETKSQQAANIDAYRNQITVMNERFGNMLKQLPTENEMPGLLEDISKTGTASGLAFKLFAPQPEVKHDFYIELPIKIAVEGNYQQLAVFLSRIAQMGRIVTLHDFVIEGARLEKQKNTSEDLLLMQITAKIYRYRAS